MARRMYDLDNGTEAIKVKSIKTNIISSSGGVTFTGITAFNGPIYFSKYSTASRPTNIGEGAVIYDIALKKCILWNGTAWVNLDGTALS